MEVFLSNPKVLVGPDKALTSGQGELQAGRPFLNRQPDYASQPAN
jgi:hypothetical protein